MKIKILTFSLIIFSCCYNFSQNYVWAKNIGGSTDNLSNSIILDAAGNVFITGYFSGTADFDTGPGLANLTSNGQSDIFVAKYDNAGNYSWAINVGGTADDIGNFVQVDATGNVYVTGFFEATADFDPGAATVNLIAGGGYDIFMAKYDNTGNYVWAKNIGSTLNDIGTSLQLDALGNVYLTGYFTGTVDFDPGAVVVNLISTGNFFDVFIAKYDNSGNYSWAKNIGGAGNDLSNALQLDAVANLYITGTFQGTADFDPGAGTANLISAGGLSDIFIAKYDNTGNYNWAKSMGGAGDDVANCLQLDAAGNVHTTGYFSGTVDFDPGAGTSNLISAGNYDIYFSKYDNSGNYIWAKGIGGSGSDVGSYLQLDAAGNVFLTGNFSGTVDFDPGAGTSTLTSAGLADIFIARYDNAANYTRVANVGGTFSSVYCNSMQMDGNGNLYITGRFQGYVDFDMTNGTFNLGSIGQDAIYIAKYNNVPIGIKEFLNEYENLKVSPNPNTGQFYLSGHLDKTILNIEIIDATGNIILQTKYENEKIIDLNNYSKGLYLLKIFSEKELIITKKICFN